MTSKFSDAPGSRVNQLDAVELDQELFSLLKAQLNNAFKYFKGNFLALYEPELDAVLKLALWGFTIHACGSTVGQQLLDLGYYDSKTRKPISKVKSISLAFLTVIVPWFKERWLDRVLNKLPEERRDRVEAAVNYIDVGIKIGAVLNFLVFLQKNTFHSLPARVLGLQMLHGGPQLIREVQYDYMNRELLWHGFAEFLTFILPLINIHKIRNFIFQKLLYKHVTASIPTERTRSDFGQCSICMTKPVSPSEAGCRHVFCYYCITSHVMADEKFSCPSCHHSIGGVENIRPASYLLAKS